MSGLVWTPDAPQDLDALFDYIGEQNHSPLAAAKLIRSIAERCQLYADQPLIGEARPELGEAVRSFTIGAYVVIYRPLQGGIIVLRIIHGARDIPAIFRQLLEDESEDGSQE